MFATSIFECIVLYINIICISFKHRVLYQNWTIKSFYWRYPDSIGIISAWHIFSQYKHKRYSYGHVHSFANSSVFTSYYLPARDDPEVVLGKLFISFWLGLINAGK